MLIAGLDEAGRGPLAGPVVAAAVIFPEGYADPEIRDSKQLSPRNRETLAGRIRQAATAWAVVAVGHRRIEELNIRQASLRAMELALARLKVVPDLVLIDGNVPITTNLPQRTVVQGDRKHVQISAASIIAKVFRDELMAICDARYPGYAFSQHAGYGTPAHREAIIRLGPCPIHRRTFQGVREYIGGARETPPGLRAEPRVAVPSSPPAPPARPPR